MLFLSFFSFFAAFFSLGVSKAFFLPSLFDFCSLLMMFSFDAGGGGNFRPAVSCHPAQHDTLMSVRYGYNRGQANSSYMGTVYLFLKSVYCPRNHPNNPTGKGDATGRGRKAVEKAATRAFDKMCVKSSCAKPMEDDLSDEVATVR